MKNEGFLALILIPVNFSIPGYCGNRLRLPVYVASGYCAVVRTKILIIPL